MYRQESELTNEKFQEIYTNKEFRNAIAHAHECYTQHHEFKHMKALMYPIDYIVTEQQIELAKKELKRAKNEVLEKHKNDLLFVCMGGNFESEDKNNPSNHRIRSTFKNKHGHAILVEFSTKYDDKSICYVSGISVEECEDSHMKKQYKSGLKYGTFFKYDTKHLLDFVNSRFHCNFENFIVSRYDVHPSDRDILCESPK